MPIDFPTGPTTGQVYVYQGNSWIYNGSAWDKVEPTLAPNTFAIQLNEQLISTDYTIASGYNGVSAGPVNIASGVTVTIADGSSWSIV
jgi:hypothetical protein